MKIELELDRDEAHELNAIITLGCQAAKKGDFSRDAIIAVEEWNSAYTEALANDED